MLCALFAVWTAGCGGPSGSGGLNPVATATPGTTLVQFNIVVPEPSSFARRPAYISASTKSVSIAIAPGNTLMTVNCTTVCTASVAAPVGSDTFTVKLFDGLNGTGNLLSSASLTQTIVAFQGNTVNLTFNGVVSSLAVSLNPTSVTVGAARIVTVTVNALDADGSIIVGPGSYSTQSGNPLTLTLHDSDTSGATLLTTTTLTAPTSGLTVLYSGASLAGAIISVTAPNVATAQATLTVTTPATPSPSPSPSPTSSPSPSPTPTRTPSPAPTHTASPTPSPSPTPSAAPSGVATLEPIQVGPGSIGWAPYAVANSFQFPVQSGYNGAGFTVAIVGDYPPSSTDLSAYLAQFGIQTTGTYQIENVDGGSQMNDQEGLLEATLDVETVMALAPGANIIFYSMPDASGISFLDDVSQIVSDQKANVASASYGGCEDPSDVTVMQPIFAQAMNEKMAWVASSGDQGDRCTSTSPTGVVYPASDPNVIGVGGTQTSSKITSTKVWNDDVGASGGGISALFSLPQYQNGLSGEASTTFRNVPDVAMPAVFDEIYFQGQWSDVDGTSWGAPQVAALIAEIDEYCNSALRDPVDIFYYALAGKGYADFSDVITGNNQYDADATFYSAQPGFDNVSGIGIPLGMPVAQTVCPNRIPALSRFRRSLAFAAPLSAAARGVPNIAGLGDRGKRASAAATRIAIVLQPAANLAQNEQSVIASLRSNGFTVTHASRNHLVIDAEAPASVVARYFGTELHDFDQPSYGVRYANVTPIALPSAIAPYVQGLLANDLVLDGSRPHRVRGF